jgi:hypothetical protein
MAACPSRHTGGEPIMTDVTSRVEADALTGFGPVRAKLSRAFD